MVSSSIAFNNSSTSRSKKYSLSRLLKSKNSLQHCLETEISSEYEDRFGKKEFDFLIPPEVLGLRSLATDNTGSNLVATSNSEFYYLAPQPASAIIPLGAKLLTGLSDNHQINISAEPFQVYWVGERDLIADTQPKVDKKVLQPKKLVASCTMTTEMWHQLSDSTENLLAEGMSQALWAEIEKVVLAGNGSTRPSGLVSEPGVNSIILGIDGGQLGYDAIVEMESLVTANNPNPKNLGYLINSDTASALKKTEKVGGSGEFILTDQPLQPTDEFKVLNSRLCATSNNLPNNLTKGTSTDLSMTVFGDWSSVIIGIFGGIDVQVDPFTNGNSSRGLVTLRMLARVDVAFTNPKLFTVATDVKTN